MQSDNQFIEEQLFKTIHLKTWADPWGNGWISFQMIKPKSKFNNGKTIKKGEM